MQRSRVAVVVAVMAVCAVARAGVIAEVGPFVGDLQEGFEDFDYGEVPAGPHDVFGGAGEISFAGYPSNYLWVYSGPGEPFAWGLGGGVTAGLFDGAKGMALDGSYGDIAIVEFADPVAAFGGYWAVSTGAPTIDFRFFDQSGGLIETTQIFYDAVMEGGELVWHGWTSSTPIARIEIEGDYAAFDGLQINVVPAPVGSMVLVMAVVCRRHRRSRMNCKGE